MREIKLNLGAQLYTLREYCKTAEDFADTMRKVAGIGYRRVQVSGVGAEVTPAVIKKSADETGLKVMLTHTNPGRILSDTDAVIEEHKLIGCNAIGIGSCPFGATIDGFNRLINEYAPAVEKIKAAGMIFLYHNHRMEFEKYENEFFLDILLKGTDPDAVKLTFDTYWAVSGGIDPAKYIREHGDRIFCTHLKDMRVVKDETRMTEMLTGNMNFDSIMEACAETGVLWHFVEQDNVYMDAFESMKISNDNLKARFAMI